MDDNPDETRIKAWSAYQRIQRLRVTIVVALVVIALIVWAIVSVT